MNDRGHFNIKGIEKNFKTSNKTPMGGTFKKHKDYKPTGKALALSNKLKHESSK